MECAMTNSKDAALVRALREAAHGLAGSVADYDPLLKLIGDARFVLLGEARMERMTSTISARRLRSA
jgi:erythromycin esterase-like protein